MKKLVLILASLMLILASAGFANKKTATAADQLAIKKAVLKASHFTGRYKYDGGVAKTKPKFEPIKIDGNWASAYYDETSNVRGLEEIPSEAAFILKKSGGKWRAVYRYLEGSMSTKECKKIGLPVSVARKLGVQTYNSNTNDGEIGHVIR